MKFIKRDDYRSVSTSCEVPLHYLEYQISGAVPLYVKGDFGDYLTQVIPAVGYHIQLNIFSILTDKLLHPYTPRSIIPLHFMLRGNIKYMVEGFGEAWLLEKCINLFYVPGNTYHEAWFKPGFYKSFHIDFSPRLLARLATKYSELEGILSWVSAHSEQGTQLHTSYITPIVQKIVNEVLYTCPIGEPDLSTFAEIKGKELLLKYVRNTSIEPERAPSGGKALIDRVTAFMKTHLEYPFTIRLLANMFGTNETALKRQFKQYTGQTIYRFLIERRMKEALTLLHTSRLSIRNIALQVGYEDFSSFDRAFSHHFGHSPAFYRKK